MKILVTGACGLLGSHLTASLSHRYEVVGVDRHPWWGDKPQEIVLGELAAPDCARSIVARVAPDVLIHCAALANVEACEQDPVLAYTVNAEITQRLVEAVSPRCLVVYISTDGLFKGTTPFTSEEELPCPRTVYGRSKLHGEWAVQLASDNHLIVRTNFYGWSSGRKPTAAEWLYEALEKERPVTLFDDFFFTPLYVVDLVERLEFLIQAKHRGLFHLCGRDRISKSQFGIQMGQRAGFSMAHVRHGSIGEASLAAPRPRDMSLDCSRFCRVTGRSLPGSADGLDRFLRDRGIPLSARFDAHPDLKIQAWTTR